jgi:hypothetical protein
MFRFCSRHRRALLLGVPSLFGALGLMIGVAVQTVPQAGPLVANSLRAVVGIEAVARLEELAAAAEDALMRARFHDEESRSLKAMTQSIVSESPSVAGAVVPASHLLMSIDPGDLPASPEPAPAALPAFTPEAIRPPYPEVAAEADGVWMPVPDPEHPEQPALMYATLLHPDRERRWAELFVVALPSALIQLRPVPGSEEPATDNPRAATLPHRGLIPAHARDRLLAAFNGGFRAEHGQHGMMVDGVTLLPARSDMCTVAGYVDGTLRIGTHARLAALSDKPSWFRQSPRCMVEGGELNARLRDDSAKGWGATLDGDTIIRRSAIAQSRDGAVLYVGVTNYTSARALALGMQAVGGWNVAQLDVNKSFPKFLLFPRDERGGRHAASLFDGFMYQPHEMLDEAAERDFFYIVRRQTDERAEASEASMKQPG